MRPLKPLAVNRCLNDDTRVQGVLIAGDVYSLHITKGDHEEVILTDNSDYTKIYSIQSLGMYQMLESQNLEMH